MRIVERKEREGRREIVPTNEWIMQQYVENVWWMRYVHDCLYSTACLSFEFEPNRKRKAVGTTTTMVYSVRYVPPFMLHFLIASQQMAFFSIVLYEQKRATTADLEIIRLWDILRSAVLLLCYYCHNHFHCWNCYLLRSQLPAKLNKNLSSQKQLY